MKTHHSSHYKSGDAVKKSQFQAVIINKFDFRVKDDLPNIYLPPPFFPILCDYISIKIDFSQKFKNIFVRIVVKRVSQNPNRACDFPFFMDPPPPVSV